MQVQLAIQEIKRQQSIIDNANAKIRELTESLAKGTSEDFDWITVKEGARILKCSMPLIYQKINEGKLSVKHINSRKYVKLSELKSIDDKYVRA